MPRPQEVMQEANRIWNDTLGLHLQKGKSYRQAVKIAQRHYDKYLRDYDRKHSVRT